MKEINPYTPWRWTLILVSNEACTHVLLHNLLLSTGLPMHISDKYGDEAVCVSPQGGGGRSVRYHWLKI